MPHTIILYVATFFCTFSAYCSQKPTELCINAKQLIQGPISKESNEYYIAIKRPKIGSITIPTIFLYDGARLTDAANNITYQITLKEPVLQKTEKQAVGMAGELELNSAFILYLKKILFDNNLHKDFLGDFIRINQCTQQPTLNIAHIINTYYIPNKKRAQPKDLTHELKDKNASLQKALEEKELEQTKYQAELLNIKQQFEEQTRSLSTQLETLTKDLSIAQTSNNLLIRTVDDSKSQLETCKKTLEEKNTQIATLQQSLEEIQESTQTSQSSIQSLSSTIKSLNQEKDQLTAKISSLELKEIASKEPIAQNPSKKPPILEVPKEQTIKQGFASYLFTAFKYTMPLGFGYVLGIWTNNPANAEKFTFARDWFASGFATLKSTMNLSALQHLFAQKAQ